VKLDSVRSLKRELYEPFNGRGGLQPQHASQVSVPAERTADVALAQPGLALGVARGTSENDYVLAVRVQHRDLVASSKLDAIRRAAHEEVDVRYIGQLTKLASSQQSRIRPLRIGSSVGHVAITAGTIGAFVRVGDDPQPRLLSNNHVLADENRGDVGDAILQPGRLDGGEPASDAIATLERFEKLDGGRVNHVDAALALLADGIDVITEIEGVGTPSNIIAVEDVLSVAKLGRTTGLTYGTVTAIEVDNVVVDFSTGRLRFDGQIEIAGADGQPFSKGGDSGSLIVDASNASALGLLFAGSDQGGPHSTGVTYASPLGEVFDRLGIDGLW